MFSGTPNPLSLASTLPTSENTIMYKPGVLITEETETNIDAISRATTMFFGIPSPAELESTVSDFRKQRQVQNPVLGTVSTSGLYMILFEVGYCRNRCKWIGRALNIAVAAENTLMFSVAKL